MLVPEGESKEFLGQEFLTWLWYRGESNQWTFDFSGGERVSYAIEDLLVLEPESSVGCKQRLAGPFPVGTPEAKTGLYEGKKVSTARIILVHEDREWSVTCHADDFRFSSLKLLRPSTSFPDDRFFELVVDLEEAVSLFDCLYNFFLEVRLSSDWDKELLAIREWARKKENQ